MHSGKLSLSLAALCCCIRFGVRCHDDLSVRLNNGVQMPSLAFAAQLWDANTCKTATEAALQAGFRFIWSSALVGPACQKAQGEVLKASSIPRSELFIGGTVSDGDCSSADDCYAKTMSAAKAQFSVLDIDTLDMLMLDYPSSSGCSGIVGQWKAFEELYLSKKVRTISVSNFDTKQLACITANSSATVPSVNQMQYSVGHGSDTVVADDGKLGIVVQAYSPLGSGSLVHDPLLQTIGKAHSKSAVQVALRWIIQRKATIATQSTNLQHLKDDLDIANFELSDKEMQQLNAHSVVRSSTRASDSSSSLIV